MRFRSIETFAGDLRSVARIDGPAPIFFPVRLEAIVPGFVFSPWELALGVLKHELGEVELFHVTGRIENPLPEGGDVHAACLTQIKDVSNS